MLTDRQHLDAWESHLRLQIGEGDILLGELSQSDSDLDEIGSLLADTAFYHLRGKRYTIEETLHQIRDQWPLTFALYLVLEGAHHYGEETLYWGNPRKRLGIEDNHTHRCGRLFLDTLEKFNLPAFAHSRGHAYVTPILLHGGIPNDQLEEFLNFLWRYEIEPHQIALDAGALLGAWRQEPKLHFAYLRRPVSRFLRYGGRVAEDFMDRCLDLFHITRREEVDDLDLPERVLDAYWAWRKKHEDQFRMRPRQPLIRLQKPILTIAPYTTGVAFYLPPQQLPSSQATETLTWRIMTDNEEKTVPTIRQRIEGGYHYIVTGSVPVSPASQYTIHLDAGSRRFQTWSMPAFASDQPLLVFEPYDDYEGDALNEEDQHKSGRRWLLYPQNWQIAAAGQSQCIRALPLLNGVWRSYRLEEWELRPDEITLVAPDGKRKTFPISGEVIRRRPYLDGGNRIPLSSPSDFPLYQGKPPQLVITTREPHRWHIGIRAEGDAQPSGYHVYRLSELSFQRENSTIRLDLSLPRLLGPQPVGKFEIVTRGPLGWSKSIGLRLLPNLQVVGHDTLYLTNPHESATVQIETDEQTTIRQSPPQDGVVERRELTAASQHRYTFTLKPHVKQLLLQLHHVCGVKLPLTVPIHRLRWMLWTEDEKETLSWQTQSFSFFPGALRQSELRLHIPSVTATPLRVGWSLLDTQGNIKRTVLPGKINLAEVVAVPLTELLPVWRERQEPLCWQIVLQQEGLTGAIVINACYLLPTLEMGEMDYEWNKQDDKVYFSLTWSRLQLGQLQLRLWPLDRAWIETPITQPFVATHESFANWQFSLDELPPEAYLAEVVVYNPWESNRPVRPRDGSPNTLLVKPPDLQEHYTWLKLLCDDNAASAEQMIALLMHQFYNDRQDDMYEMINLMGRQANTMPFIWILRWLNSAQLLDKNSYRLVQIRAFPEPVFERLAKEKDAFTPDLLRQLLNHLPERIPEPQAIWILRSGLQGEWREKCFELLLNATLNNDTKHKAFQEAVGYLLEGVVDGSVLINHILSIVSTNRREVARFLAQDGGRDASELLKRLTQDTPLQPEWIWPGIQIETNVGLMVVEKLRQRQTTQPIHCAPLSGNLYAEGHIVDTQGVPMPARLDLHNRLLHFHNLEPYQCPFCQRLSHNVRAFQEHCQRDHPLFPVPPNKRLKRDLSLTTIQGVLPENE